jgi:hypothetical protein
MRAKNFDEALRMVHENIHGNTDVAEISSNV